MLFFVFAVSTAIQNTGIAFTSSRFKHTSWSNRRVREPLSMPLTTSRELQHSLQLRHRLFLSFNFKILRRRRRAEQEKSKKGQEIKYAHALHFPDFIFKKLISFSCRKLSVEQCKIFSTFYKILVQNWTEYLNLDNFLQIRNTYFVQIVYEKNSAQFSGCSRRVLSL